ncbi:MAG: single-stranded-DNA-specific exonuclease RecJ, partial [Burkholderiaceae bacterium]
LAIALERTLREAGWFAAGERREPDLIGLLDLVALGTVADVVRLDANNRLLVAQGLKRIRAGRLRPGLAALFHVAGRHARSASTGDLGFSIGPRLNAAGRLADMRIGIQTLLCDDPGRALELARTLDAMNRDRQTIESTMKDDALALLDGFEPQQAGTVVLQHPAWHQGVIGIVASRIKDQYFRPTIAFAPGDAGEWKGSGRSVPGVHLRDALDLVVKRLPAGSIPKFGGHAMAAGLTIKDHALAAFRVCFDAVVRDLIGPAGLERRFEHDGSLALAYCNAHTAELLAAEVWGQGFPPPVFVDTFEVLSQRLLKDAHSKLQLRRDGATFTALWWRHTEAVAARLRVAYRIERDDFNGNGAVQLIVEHATAA